MLGITPISGGVEKSSQQLAVYAGKDFSAPGPVTAEVSDEMEGAVSNLIDTHGLTLLSWHQPVKATVRP